MPRRFGSDWNPATKGIPRGAWPVCGEIDHGPTAGVEAAATIVVDDPVFGLFAYGGVADEKDGEVRVVPRDGVRHRLHVLRGGPRLALRLDRDGLEKGAPWCSTLRCQSCVCRWRTGRAVEGAAPAPRRLRCRTRPC